MNDYELPSVAGRMEMTHLDFQRACQVQLLHEQEKGFPDNSLIHVLCESVRCSRECCEIAGGSESKREIDHLRAENARLARSVEEIREMAIMQLAGISTATIQNTESTVKDRITRDNPYWSVAYQDVCVAVDREMKHRADLQRHKSALEKAREALLYMKLQNHDGPSDELGSHYNSMCSLCVKANEALAAINEVLK